MDDEMVMVSETLYDRLHNDAYRNVERENELLRTIRDLLKEVKELKEKLETSNHELMDFS